jgi:oligopeptidase A
MTNDNPLLDFSGLPRFSDILTEHVEPAIDELLAKAKTQLEITANTPPDQASWEDTLLPLDVACEQLGRAWGVVGHLHSVADSEALRAAYNACLPKTTEFWTMLGQDERLYGLYKAIEQSDAAKTFTAARLKVLANSIRGFKLGGAELPADQKPRYAAIQDRQAAITAKFSENVLDSTNAFELLVTDQADLEGIPEYAVAAARELAQSEDKDGYKFTLQFPSYFPVLQYAKKRELRETLYEAYAKRASEFGPPNLDNTALIRELLELREEESKMLGYANFGELSLVPKMANSPDEVIAFLRELATKAKPFAQRDLKELTEFARDELGMTDLQSWDISYVSEKLKEKKYAFSDQEVRQYFQEDRVLDGLFKLTERLFGVSIVKAQADTWHADVRFFEVQKDGQAIAHFYLDPYARASKRSGAWMDDARGRKRTAQGVQTPVAYLTCNYTKPAAGKAAQLSHDDVQTLFHEFGHGIHHMLTRVDELDVAGINGVEWDAVELPSQFMENFAWEWSVVESLTAHETTGQPMPKALFDKMVAAKNFQSGLQTLRQIEFSLFDMLIHTSFDPKGEQSILDVLQGVRDEVAVLTPPAYNRFPNSFSHIFAGGYAAGYYSYKWAEVLSADAFAMFEENGVVSPETGKKFLEEILSVGGSRPAAVSFKAFRGREPSMDALLRHTGMTNEQQAA